jgi:hypothetical protein
MYAMHGGYTTNGAIYRICPPGVFIVEKGEDGFAVSIGPNPTNDKAVIRFDLQHATEITIQLYDIRGNEIFNLTTGSLQKGIHEIQLHTRELQLSPAVYTCRITAEDIQVTRHLKLLISE